MQATLRRRKHQESNFELQITALVDTLVIILIFMLKSAATDSLEIEQPKGMIMPSVLNGMSAATGNRLDITSEGVAWNGQRLLQTAEYNVKKPINGEEGWKALGAAIAATVADEKSQQKFEGKVFLQADKTTPFPVIQEVLKVAKSHGYKDIRFVAAKLN
jgi:biopolymer transport protein ExbD